MQIMLESCKLNLWQCQIQTMEDTQKAMAISHAKKMQVLYEEHAVEKDEMMDYVDSIHLEVQNPQPPYDENLIGRLGRLPATQR